MHTAVMFGGAGHTWQSSPGAVGCSWAQLFNACPTAARAVLNIGSLGVSTAGGPAGLEALAVCLAPHVGRAVVCDLLQAAVSARCSSTTPAAA